MPCKPLDPRRYPPTLIRPCEDCGAPQVWTRGRTYVRHTRRGSELVAEYRVPVCAACRERRKGRGK